MEKTEQSKRIMMLGKSRLAPPKANAMIEALRGLGYTTATALADIIDNSISAEAKHVSLSFFWSAKHSYISILDDGNSMDADELDMSMRLGELSPLAHRSANDLGRFGLGLKTASFSQCRRLTVASIKNDTFNCLRWDLDILAASKDGEWRLFEGPAEGSEQLLVPLKTAKKGTLVLWECLDKIITPDYGEQDFLDLIDDVELHLAMIFHRYLEGANPDMKLSINERAVIPWDPFLESHPVTWKSPIEHLNSSGGSIEVQGYVLPHKDHLSAAQEQSAAGPHGWTAQQGFYVYRNRRLLVAGSWLGLGKGRSWAKEEAHRLARLRLDITNSADSDWKIDIKKSTASPPVALRSVLSRIAEDTRTRARRVFARRSEQRSSKDNNPILFAWRTERTSKGIRYRIDREHPVIRTAIENSGESLSTLETMLRVIEETVPIERIWLDTAESRETPSNGFNENYPEEIRAVLMVMYRNLLHRKGVCPSLAREQLLRTEPFNNYSDLVSALPDQLENGV